MLILHISQGVKFQINKRGKIRFDEVDVDLDVSLDCVDGIYVGDMVNVHSVLECPWNAEVDERDHLHGPLQVVAFVTLRGSIKKVSMKGTFCILRKEMDGAGSSPHNFVMTGEKLDKIALYFINALERVEE